MGCLRERRTAFLKPIIRWGPKHYDLISPIYDAMARWFFPMAEEGSRLALQGTETGIVLDVACGTGTLLKRAEKMGLAVLGIDRSGGMLRRAKTKLSKTPLIQGDFYTLPFADGTFDLVLETNAVSGADIESERVIAEMFRICKPEGEVRFVDYTQIAEPGAVRWALIKLSELIGDQPFDYVGHCSRLGYAAEKVVIGWGGMYQLVRVKKAKTPS